jgi:hypothetical protein
MTKVWDPAEIRARIKEILPEGKVIARHNKDGHFYEVDMAVDSWAFMRKHETGYTLPAMPAPGVVSGKLTYNPIYPSVTGKLQILKDEGLINYKMNRAVDYLRNFIFSLTALPTMEDISQACQMSTRVSQDILEDAGDIGTRIHNVREAIFLEWIKTGERPADFLSFIPANEEDVRTTSAIRALQKFCEERDYVPVACELLVYNHELATAGTLDDLGLIRKIYREGNPDCPHTELVSNGKYGIHRCMTCDMKYGYEFALMDLKTSNQFKDHYFFQVALYWWKLWNLLGKEWKPQRCFILKVSKEDGSYKIEDLKRPAKLAQYARAMIKTNEGVEFIKSLRKDNQKVVAPLMQL